MSNHPLLRPLLTLGTALALALPSAPAAAQPTEPTLTSEWRRPPRPTPRATAPDATKPAPRSSTSLGDAHPRREAARPPTRRAPVAPASPRRSPVLIPQGTSSAPAEAAASQITDVTQPAAIDPGTPPAPSEGATTQRADTAPLDVTTAQAAAPSNDDTADAPDLASPDPAPASPPVPEDSQRPLAPPQLASLCRPTTPECRAPRPARNALGELVAGAVFTSAGLLSAGIAARGLYLTRVSERELANSDGYPAELIAPLYPQQQRGETMLAAGAVAGGLGLALGIALLATGARDLKAARRSRPLADLRLSPTPRGLTLTGRF